MTSVTDISIISPQISVIFRLSLIIVNLMLRLGKII